MANLQQQRLLSKTGIHNCLYLKAQYVSNTLKTTDGQNRDVSSKGRYGRVLKYWTEHEALTQPVAWTHPVVITTGLLAEEATVQTLLWG